jgi:hypothetical protein
MGFYAIAVHLHDRDEKSDDGIQHQHDGPVLGFVKTGAHQAVKDIIIQKHHAQSD